MTRRYRYRYREKERCDSTRPCPAWCGPPANRSRQAQNQTIYPCDVFRSLGLSDCCRGDHSAGKERTGRTCHTNIPHRLIPTQTTTTTTQTATTTTTTTTTKRKEQLQWLVCSFFSAVSSQNDDDHHQHDHSGRRNHRASTTTTKATAVTLPARPAATRAPRMGTITITTDCCGEEQPWPRDGSRPGRGGGWSQTVCGDNVHDNEHQMLAVVAPLLDRTVT